MSLPSTRKISNDVYTAIEKSGALTGLRATVFAYIYKNGPVTIAQALRDIPSKRDSSVNARFSELRRMGVIEQVGMVPDPTGGNHEISAWDLTGRHPVELKDERREFWLIIWTENEQERIRVCKSPESAERWEKTTPGCEVVHLKEVLRARG